MKTVMTIQGRRAISVVLFLITAALLGSKAYADDALPTVTIEDATAREGSLITFVARLDKPNRTRNYLQFSWKTKGGTATPGQDYTDNEYTASFLPGESKTEIHLFTTRDDLDEGSETFELVASDPWRLKLGNTTATGTIEDPPKRSSSNLPVVSVLPGAGVTEGEAAAFKLIASPRPAKPLQGQRHYRPDRLVRSVGPDRQADRHHPFPRAGQLHGEEPQTTAGTRRPARWT